MQVLRIEALPAGPLEAAAEFYATMPPRAGEDLLLVFPPADHTHRDWRLAAVRGLAREQAPRRVNAIAADSETAIAAALRYLEQAPGVTGHFLPLDGAGAGAVIGSQP